MNESAIDREVLKIMTVQNSKNIELAKTLTLWPHVLRHAVNQPDDALALSLEIDKGNFSRILSGQANFPIEKLIKFCRLVDNDLPLHWLAYQAGYELRVIPKTLEEKIIEKDRLIEEQARKIQNYEECFSKLGAKIKE